MPYVKLLNGIDTIHQDHDLSSYFDALASGGVYEGLGVSVNDNTVTIAPGRAIVECHRSSGEKIMALFVLEEELQLSSSDGHIAIVIKQDHIDNKYLNNEAGEGIGSIEIVSSTGDNMIVLGSVSSGSISLNDRQTVTISGDIIDEISIDQLRDENGDPVNVATEERVAQSLAEAGSVSYLSAKRELGEDFIINVVEVPQVDITNTNQIYIEKQEIDYEYQRILNIAKTGTPGQIILERADGRDDTKVVSEAALSGPHNDGNEKIIDGVVRSITFKIDGTYDSKSYVRITDLGTGDNIYDSQVSHGGTVEKTFSGVKRLKIHLEYPTTYLYDLEYTTLDSDVVSVAEGDNNVGYDTGIYIIRAEGVDEENLYHINEKYVHHKIVGYFLGRGAEYVTVPETDSKSIGETTQDIFLKLKTNEEKTAKVSLSLGKVGEPSDALNIYDVSHHYDTHQVGGDYYDESYHTVKNMSNAIGPISCIAQGYSGNTKIIRIVDQATGEVLHSQPFGESRTTISYSLESTKSVSIQARGYRRNVKVKNFSYYTKNELVSTLEEGENTIYANGDMIVLEATGISPTNYRTLHSSDGFLSGEYVLGYELDKIYLSNPDTPSRCSVDGLSYTGGKEGDVSLGIEGGIRKHGLSQSIIGKVYVKSDGAIDTTEATKLCVGEGLGTTIRINNKIITTGETTTTATTGGVTLGNAEGYLTVIVNGEQKKIPYYGV